MNEQTQPNNATTELDLSQAIEVTNEAGSQTKITGTLPYAELEKERDAALAHLGADVELDGFRKGHVPNDMLEKHLGQMQILSEMAERTLARVYPQILSEYDIQAIGQPEVEVSQLAPDNPFSFTATVAVMPDIDLPEYKSVAQTVNQEKESVEVTDEEVQKQIDDILRQKVAYDRLQAKAQVDETEAAAASTSDDTIDLPTPESEAKKAEQANEADTDAAALDPENIEPPELTDELVKELGQPGQFNSVDEFKEKVREHVTIEKERDVSSRHRSKVTDAIVEQSTIDVPQLLIDSELNQMFAQMEEDLQKNNLQMADYLQHIQKSKDDLREEWRPAAEKRAKLQLVLNEIAKRESVTPEEQEVEQQVQQLLEQHQDADEDRVRVYVTSVLKNESVMKMLEEQ